MFNIWFMHTSDKHSGIIRENMTEKDAMALLFKIWEESCDALPEGHFAILKHHLFVYVGDCYSYWYYMKKA